MTSSTAPSAEAIHLLSYDQNIWSLNEDALATIQQCKPPIHSLAIMGKGRSGKSTLLNLICWYFGDEGRGCVPKVKIQLHYGVNKKNNKSSSGLLHVEIMAP